ncbi:hypothetical protein EDD90_1978 [Streptomyces sp. Ag109_O5-1]|uniref:hypothetical protein n=1 Tax=Streptomyces sp. Ag109_O5-1 TaxID=1938851 RepID=UPI000F4DC005|nr:hypothetical protein [Streptomyces sp. Ag109_O5-1]RPE39024.1 hypothetical protein EDD90_1978 [Streptomyces sp. Ag109_O5-1]
MNEPYPPLSETLARVDELCRLLRASRDNVLDVTRLSRATGLTGGVVELLLAGGSVDPVDPETMVRERVRFLFEHYDRGDLNQVPALAAAIKQTPTWTKKLVLGQAKPNIFVGAALCKHYGIDSEFLTDFPEDALNRELRKILFDLELKADPGKTLADLGVAHVSRRNPFGDPDLTALARMVAEIVKEELRPVTHRLDRLELPESDR